MITSEWGTPNMVEAGVNPELLLGNKYGHKLHVFDMKRRRHLQEIDLGAEHQMVLELRPAHDPDKAYGFVGVVTSTADLSASVFMWERNPDGSFAAQKVISIPAEPAEEDQLPDAPAVRRGAAAGDGHRPLRSTTARCTSPAGAPASSSASTSATHDTPRDRLGAHRRDVNSPHPAAGAVNGGPQMVEVSRDGRRVYLTNSLYRSWDEQFYPEGINGWLVKLDAGEDGSLALDPELFVEFPQGERPHQVRLQGGDASSDSYCFPERRLTMETLLSSPSRCSAPTTGSTPRWAGCSRWGSGCRIATGVRCCVHCRRSRPATSSRSHWSSRSWSAWERWPIRARSTKPQPER